MDSSTQSTTSVSWPAEVAMVALSGAVTAYLPVHRWTRRARWALHAGVGATTAVTVLVGVTMAAASRGGEAADGWVEHRLAGRGVRRPRLWIGVGAAVLTLAMGAADRRTASRRAESQIVPGSEGGGDEPGVGG